ncbi:polysaccharide deacetylase family protein [Candidatus Woesearchaeota archaeon]|nr:polysaccharide deacetylase family protein [Candidatus Woesearchaeota archaeon]
MKSLVLTFDTEEFDLPTEFGLTISHEDQMRIGREGTLRVLAMLERKGLKATFFTTGKFTVECADLFSSDAFSGHELAMHGAAHHHHYNSMRGDEALTILRGSKAEMEKVTGRRVVGFRAPRFEKPALSVVREAGFLYDSSLHPTYVPGRYNHFFKNSKPHLVDGLVVFPLSVSPLWRAPLSWIWFRNMPLVYSKGHARLLGLSDDCLHLYFHPWEFVDLSAWKGKIPASIIRKTGVEFEKKVEEFIGWCLSRGMVSETAEGYLRRKGLIE